MSITAKIDMPHPAVLLDDCPQLHGVIAELEAGTYPQPTDAIWREDLPRETRVRLARATGATDEQIAEALTADEPGNAEAAEPLNSCTVCAGPIFEGERVQDYAGCTAHYGCVPPEPEQEPEQEPAEGCKRLTITHSHADGTFIHGSCKGDGVYELIGPRTAARFKYMPSIQMIGIAQSRDHLAKRWQIEMAAEALRKAGHVVTVEIDDTPRDVTEVKADRAERLDNRYERLSTKAERTAAEAAARHAAADAIGERFAGGQPILVGHHSERRARRDHEKMERNDRAAGELYRKAERVAAAASVVGSAEAYRERPGVIRRRIDRLNAELRQTDHYINGTRPANDWRGAYGYDRKPATGDYLEQLTARKTYLEHQIAGDEAALEALKAAGYVMLTREDLHKGDRVHWGATWGDGMQGAIVTRVNPKTVTLDRTRWPRTLPYEQIKRVECPHEDTETTVKAPKPAAKRREPVTVQAEQPAEREAPVVVDARSQFFPTPAPIVDRMLGAAGHTLAGMRVLEPSAGLGAIARPAAARGASVDCIELDYQLAARLREAGFTVQAADFLEVPQRAEYDRVMMNPPFASRADVRHVLHALGFLKPGGLLVAIMSASAATRDDNLTTGFRATVEERGGTITALPDDAFKESGTGVRTVLVTITAPAPVVTPETEPDTAAELAGTLF